MVTFFGVDIVESYCPTVIPVRSIRFLRHAWASVNRSALFLLRSHGFFESQSLIFLIGLFALGLVVILFPQRDRALHRTSKETMYEDGDGKMTTISRHFFGDSEGPSFSLSIIENMKEDYGLFIWPCSIILAEYVWQQRLRFSGVNVVELGAGTCLPGLLAAKVGAHVTLTDDAQRLEVLDNMRTVSNLNKLDCQVLGLTWGVWDESIFSLHPKIILGADVLYDNRAFDNLFSTVAFLLQSSPGSVFITTYHNRSGHHLIEFLMVKWGLKCLKLIDGFSFLPSNKASKLSGNIQVAEIALSLKQNEVVSGSAL